MPALLKTYGPMSPVAFADAWVYSEKGADLPAVYGQMSHDCSFSFGGKKITVQEANAAYRIWPSQMQALRS